MGMSKTRRHSQRNAKTASARTSKRHDRQVCNKQMMDGDGESIANRVPIGARRR